MSVVADIYPIIRTISNDVLASLAAANTATADNIRAIIVSGTVSGTVKTTFGTGIQLRVPGYPIGTKTPLKMTLVSCSGFIAKENLCRINGGPYAPGMSTEAIGARSQVDGRVTDVSAILDSQLCPTTVKIPAAYIDKNDGSIWLYVVDIMHQPITVTADWQIVLKFEW